MIPAIWRTPYSPFSGTAAEFPDDLTDETYTALDFYSEKVCKEIRDNNFNGIWVHACFAHLVPGLFPELAPHIREQQQRLSALIARCAKYGLKVYLYGQVLRSVSASNTAFWSKNPDCAGEEEYSTEISPDGERHRFKTISLCPSSEKVRKHVFESASSLASHFPDLGGVILITATEFPGHCYQRRKKYDPDACYKKITCPSCSKREPWEVAADLITLFRDGIRSKSSDIKIIAWNWSWSMWLDAPCGKLIDLLPQDCILMADFERGGKMDLPERNAHKIPEYSLMYPGPSEEFLQVYDICKKRNMKMMSKLQLGTTHELGSIVAIPNIISIYRKAKWHSEHPETGYMGCWNFGNFFSANTASFHHFRQHCTEDKGEEEALKDFAKEYFPGCDAEKLLSSWKIFYEAMRYLPFSIGPLYYGITSCSPSCKNLFKPEALEGTFAGSSYQHFPERGDDLSPALVMHDHEFSLAEIIRGYGKCGALWDAGTMLMEEALKNCSSPHGAEELGNAILCGCCWNAAENSYRVYALRKEWSDEKIYEFNHILTGEIAILNKMLPYVSNDPRQGYHAEAGAYMFNKDIITEKIQYLQQYLHKEIL
ncbi:MAG: hypothetical protein J6S53_06920 [Lentisphaeria bacterium]|nr:hypothetical protein [Lentisphaeria bacterium]